LLTSSRQIYDYVNSELTHNKTYAHRLPPTFIEQAQALANFHENGIFSDKNMAGIGNSSFIIFPRSVYNTQCNSLVAGRTISYAILNALERISFNGDPLQFMLIETTYQAFISLFHQTEMVKGHPELLGIRTSL
jgi:lysosomal acid phosphatase